MKIILITAAVALCVLLIVPQTSAPTVSSAARETFTPAPPTPTFAPYPAPSNDDDPTPTAAPYPAPDAPAHHHPSAQPSGIRRSASCADLPMRLRGACVGVR